jgi:hypothetical protein
MADKKQVEKFREAAREAGCDPSEEAFEEKLRTIVSSSPPGKGGSDKAKPTRKKKE